MVAVNRELIPELWAIVVTSRGFADATGQRDNAEIVRRHPGQPGSHRTRRSLRLRTPDSVRNPHDRPELDGHVGTVPAADESRARVTTGRRRPWCRLSTTIYFSVGCGRGSSPGSWKTSNKRRRRPSRPARSTTPARSATPAAPARTSLWRTTDRPRHPSIPCGTGHSAPTGRRTSTSLYDGNYDYRGGDRNGVWIGWSSSMRFIVPPGRTGDGPGTGERSPNTGRARLTWPAAAGVPVRRRGGDPGERAEGRPRAPAPV